MTCFWSDYVCPTHGWVPHVFIHEAAHATAAIDHDIPFSDVTIYAPSQRTSRHDGATALGGVNVGLDPMTWLHPDPVAALEFVMAGSAAEDIIFGDMVADGFRGDLEMWRKGMGETGELSPSRLDELAGGSFAATGQRVRTWVTQNRGRIMAVAARLAGVEDLSRPTLILGENGPWTLTRAEVRRAVAI